MISLSGKIIFHACKTKIKAGITEKIELDLIKKKGSG